MANIGIQGNQDYIEYQWKVDTEKKSPDGSLSDILEGLRLTTGMCVIKWVD